MSILASLVRAYDHLPDAPPFGYSMQNIGVIVSLNEDGSVANVIDWRDGEGKRKKPRPMLVPQPVKRTAGIAPNFLWDKTSYVLGVTSGDGRRTADEHAAFKERHERELAGSDDAGLNALLKFLRQWTPDQFLAPVWPDEMRDQNVGFVLESDRRENLWLHQRDAAKALWERISQEASGGAQICLVTGEANPVARLHPSIKGVWGGQTAGASIVSFNLDAFTSYGHEQGDNAPVSELAAAKYTTALNRFLERGSGHRIQIGDASTVFWADSADAEAAKIAESAFSQFFDPADDAAAGDAAETRKIAILLERIRKGEQIEKIDAGLAKDVRFYVLGLAPNAARISIRFYFEDDFSVLGRNYQRFVEDMRIEPAWRQPYPPLWRYLRETAVLGKGENVPPNLAGEWMRSILSGTNYPLTLLAAVLSRIRADGEINALRVGMLRALLVRNYRMKPENRNKRREAPVALDPENRNKGYLLGRLFAVYEQAQTAALGRNVNATIKDKFYGSASATPRRVFSLLDRNSANHLSKVGKERPGQRVNIEKTIGAIMDMMMPGEDPFPASLSAAEQALFGLGYYHQRGEFFRKRETVAAEEAA
ncbi:CRISPR-associated protein, Csd1 family [Nitrobacter winogradskyi Nb-255]|uniref:CRISPR-associated protein, Csd1 family n=1 Tax=Nitrobacter winogradskyi (strain ATCC 25391 / DSM 10237 / CIP 104748 / NCIMB 11846 / Nb-255) TaxID=323098 RepID=Q3SR92_NITWN|nr:type I-C CRISPR-associated protein Cas8c/Csd1 [Nitrobacter winogradskyi]ABA05199.1 CRISPR-associated protein, Csd1 family [Nitrobacter winogradskyi Nb-255]